MFDQMRKNTKTILWITVAAFIGLIFLAWGADFQTKSGRQSDPTVIGMINGQPIRSQTYEVLVSQTRANFQQQYGRDLDDRTETMLRNQAWNQMIQETLLQHEAQKRGIGVSDEEVVQAVMNQPPQEVQQSPNFQTNGKFDLAKYQAALRSPDVDTRQIEAQYRNSLPVQKLQMQVLASVSVSDDELWAAYEGQSDKIKVSFALVPASKFNVDPAGVSQADMQKYYQDHKHSYLLPDQAVVEYVTVPRRYTENDSLNQVQLGKQVLQEFHGGEDFGTLIEEYSEAPPNMRGGATAAFLGSAQISDLTLRNAAFALKPGEVSDLLICSDGFHIIKVEDRKTEPTGDQVKLADIFLPLKPSADTVSQLRDEAVQFRQEVQKRSFAEVAGEMKLSLRETAPFGETGFIPGLGSAPEIQEFAFSHPEGTIGPVQERPDGWMVFRVKQRRASHEPDLTEVQERVRAETADSLRLDQAVAVAQGLLREAQGGTPLASVGAGDPRVMHDTTDPFGRLGYPKGIGADPAVIGTLFAANPGLVPEVIRGRTGAVVAVVEQKIPADKTQFEAQKQQLRMSLMQRRQSQVFSDWIAALRKNAKVEDYRFNQAGS